MGTLAKVLRRLARRPRFEYRLIMVRELSPAVPVFPLPPGMEIEELPASAEQVERAVAALPEIHRFGIAERIAAGGVCWVVRVAGEVVYQIWVSTGSTYSYTLDRHFALAPTDTVEFGAYTVPAYRGQGIHSAVVSQVLVALRERGIKRLITIMEPANRIALRVPHKLGMATVGFAAFVEIAGVRFHFMRDRGALPLVRPRHYWVKV